MSKEALAVATLLDLLEGYVELCDRWEDHNTIAMGDKGFKNLKEEKKAHAHVQQTYSLPFMQECMDVGFKYTQCFEIIAPAFKTTYIERQEQLTALREWAQRKYQHG